MEGRILEGDGKDAYDANFAQKMELAGITPTTPIGVAVSGGPDSTALCLLLRHWLSHHHHSPPTHVMAFIVDHGLRPESASEAYLAHTRISSLGIKCKILQCSWPNGIPARGQIQEAARNARYKLLQEECQRNELNVLFTAHHADDQMELFIIRLSRHSGLMGLACMPFTSETYMPPKDCNVVHKLLLVRPLLDLTKADLYMVCKKHNQPWIEDPTNENLIFLRNAIRKFLTAPEACLLRRELRQLICLCRKVRASLEIRRDCMLQKAFSINYDFGYVILDMSNFNICQEDRSVIAKAIVASAQFVAQKAKPPRGKALKVLLDHLYQGNFKGTLNLTGCSIYADPSVEGLYCISCDANLPLFGDLILLSTFHAGVDGNGIFVSLSHNQLDFHEGTSSGCPMISRFANMEDSVKLVDEARLAGILSDSSSTMLLSFTNMLSEKFHNGGGNSKGSSSAIPAQMLQVPASHACYFMNRFLLSWGRNIKENVEIRSKDGTKANHSSSYVCSLMENIERHKGYGCINEHEDTIYVRCMNQKDYLLLSKVAKMNPSVTTYNRACNIQYCSHHCSRGKDSAGRQHQPYILCCCIDILVSRVQGALSRLKAIPVPARWGLPVFVSAQGALLGVPSLGFSICPHLFVSSCFKPKVPLGGGRATWS